MIQDNQLEQEKLLTMVRHHYPDAEDICCYGSRIGGWDRHESDYDVGIYGSKYKSKILIFGGKTLVTTSHKKKERQNIWMQKFLIPRFSLITKRIDSISRASIEKYIQYRTTTPESTWWQNRDVSKIIGG